LNERVRRLRNLVLRALKLDQIDTSVAEIRLLVLEINHNVRDMQTRFENVGQDVDTLSAASLGLEMASRDLRAAAAHLDAKR
jgi:hypothetical protein